MRAGKPLGGRRWWQRMVFVAAISLSQLRDDGEELRALPVSYPYVRLIDLEDRAAGERIGTAVLTMPYEAQRTSSLN